MPKFSVFPPLPLNWLKKILLLIFKNYFYLTKESRIIHNSLHFCIDEVTVLSQGWHDLDMIFMKLKEHYCKINSLVSCPPVGISVSLSLSPYLPSFCFCYLALRVMPVFFPHISFPPLKRVEQLPTLGGEAWGWKGRVVSNSAFFGHWRRQHMLTTTFDFCVCWVNRSITIECFDVEDRLGGGVHCGFFKVTLSQVRLSTCAQGVQENPVL